MKRIFFKTVRSTGDSCWVNGVLNRNYKIGERYTFPENLPAHCFTESGFRNCGPLGLTEAYDYRREPGAGNRVLICLGIGIETSIPTVGLDCFPPGMQLSVSGMIPDEHLTFRSKALASTEFEVIGEIFCPSKQLETEMPKEGRMPIFVD